MKLGCALIAYPIYNDEMEKNVKIIHTYEEAVAYLLDIPKFTKKNTMEDTKTFLKELNLSLS